MRAGPTVGAALGATGALGWAAARLLAARIRRNPDPFPRERLLVECEGDRVEITRPDGTVLHALVAGRGPSVILVHGYTANLLEWNFVWDELQARGFRVVAFDQRGHGGSTLGSDGVGSAPMAADLAAVAEHFDVYDGVVVGHSMGGFVTIRAVLEDSGFAGRLRGMVLFATWAGRILDEAPQNRLQIPLLQYGILQRLVRNDTIAVLFGAAQCGARPAPAMISVFMEFFNRHMDEHGPLLPIVRAFSREDRYPRLGEIEVPTAVMVGTSDRTTPPSHSRRLAEGIPGARLVAVPGAGHLLNWEGADELIEVVESFPAQRS